MKILITGAGQDSSYLAEHLLNQGHEVDCMTRRSCTANHWRFANVLGNSNFKFVDGDITDPYVVSSYVSNVKPDEIYNLAAQSHVGTSFTNPSATWDSVAFGAVNIFEAVKNHSPKTAIYQASSSEMFGDMLSYQTLKLEHSRYRDFGRGPLIDIRSCFQSIETPFCPQSPYGIAKLAAHNMARVYRESYGLRIMCGILFNHESPRRGTKFVTRKITKFFKELFTNRIPTNSKLILGDINICRDWGHAKEYTEHMIRIVRDESYEFDFVFATGHAISIAEFADMAVKVASDGKHTDAKEFIVQDPSFIRPAEVPFLRGISRTWFPKTKVEQLVVDMVEQENFME